MKTAASSSAPQWRVRCNVSQGGYHPIWFGEKSGQPIQRDQIQNLADAYLAEHADWLSSIDAIDPVD